MTIFLSIIVLLFIPQWFHTSLNHVSICIFLFLVIPTIFFLSPHLFFSLHLSAKLFLKFSSLYTHFQSFSFLILSPFSHISDRTPIKFYILPIPFMIVPNLMWKTLWDRGSIQMLFYALVHMFGGVNLDIWVMVDWAPLAHILFACLKEKGEICKNYLVIMCIVSY